METNNIIELKEEKDKTIFVPGTKTKLENLVLEVAGPCT